MRFKSIFWLFNIVVLLALVFFAVSTFFMYGKDYAVVYWGNMWIVVAIFVVLIGVLDSFFLRNWQLFDFLEKEDWPALLTWLEDKIFTQGRLSRIYAGLYINTVLSTGQMTLLGKLEREISEKKPGLLPRFGVSLGLQRLQEGQSEVIREYYSPLADNPRTSGRDWARWCRSMTAGEEGISELADLIDSSDYSIRILSADLLSGRNDEVFRQKIEGLQRDLAQSGAEKAIQRSREDNLIAAVLSPNVKAARERLENQKTNLEDQKTN